MVTDVFTNSFEIYLFSRDDEELSFLAYGLAELWDGVGMSVGTAEALHTACWYMHLLDFLVFLCYLPYSKHSHVLTIAPHVFTRRLEPTGVLQPITDFEKAESFGVGKLESLTWKQMLDSYTCTECGRCTAACPASITGKVLSPKEIIVDIRHLLEEQVPAVAPWTKRPEQPTPLIEGVGFEPIWDCVTCGACMQECPVFIEHVPTIMDMRRYLVMEQANMPETAQATLMQLEQRGHPWRGAQLTRTSWIEEMAAEGIEVPLFDGTQEYLFWVGCSGALQERNVKVTKATARLLLEAGVSFGVLGNEEGCSGDPARRLGNEYLYQMQAQANIEVFKAKGVQKVLTMCPHCFNTMQHEYPQLDGRFEVLHHSVFLERAHRARGSCGRRRRTAYRRRRRPTTTPATSPATTTSWRSRAGSSPPRGRSRWRCRAARRGRSAAAPAAPTCGSRRAAASASTTRARRRRRRPAPTSSRWPAPSACRCSRRAWARCRRRRRRGCRCSIWWSCWR